MKSIIKTGKRSIIAILTLCMILGIVGTCLNVTAMDAETTAIVEETTLAAEETTVESFDSDVIDKADMEENELQPMMASGCPTDNYSYRGYSMSYVAYMHGWTYVKTTGLIYDGSLEIGRFDGANDYQGDHFHIYSWPGTHFWL